MNNVLSIEQLFSERVLRVPDYQRGYAWEKPHLDELLEDLELLPSGKHHYTGTVVLHAAGGAGLLDEEGKSYSVFNLVDGQQRLTTIVLLLDSIRREMLADGLTKLADGIKKTYVGVPALNGQPLYKLTLNSDCHRFFIENALADSPGPEGPAIFSQHRLAAAKAYFKELLIQRREELGDSFRQWLIELRNKVTQQLKLVVYIVGDESEVGVVFETMNNRGKQLTELEKAKNYLLYLATKMDVASDSIRAAINDTWAEVFKNLMAAGLAHEEDRLLRMHWVMAYNPRSKDWDGSKSIKARFNLRRHQGKHKLLLEELTQYTRTLRSASVAFCDIQSPDRTEAFRGFKQNPGTRAEIVNVSEKLRRLRVIAPFLPLLMAARLRFAEDAAAYLDLARLCEVFGFRVYRFLKKRSNTGQSMFWSLGHKLYGEQASVEEVSASIRWHILYYCPDDVFAQSFTAADGEDWYDWAGIKYFLYEYEEYLASVAKTPVQVLWKTVQEMPLEDSIEHILPQTPDDPYWTARFKTADRKLYTHDFGNLCLTLHNSNYGRKSFPKKKGTPGAKDPCYANAGFFMERALAGLNDWTVKDLLERKATMASWAVERWHVDAIGDDQGAEIQDDDEEVDE
ncbi:DUF262 domain-containing HNH endonuclease family protein [Sorangium sp. So ce1014]|uniref:DUF262 domain-containing protein n=1 Tax=Sorangium sp. So ce1014 TaxID=3133326 RepID=UPI003F600C82